MIFGKKINHITSAHPASDHRILHKECKTLAASGYSVSIVAPHEKDDLVGGVYIKAVPFAKNRWIRRTKTIWLLFRKALKENAIVYHLHDPELIPLGILFLVYGKRVIYDAHENVPHQILSNDTIPVRLRKPLSILITFFEKFVSRCFTGIVAATPAISRRFPSSKTVIVQNFPIENELKPRIKISYLARPSKVLYIGGIENIRGATEMVQAIGLIPKSFGVQLVMAGNFSNIQFENDIRKMDGWTRVDYRGWVNRGNIATLLEESRMGLVVLHPRINYLDSYPVKLFEYMAAGIPVIASDFPLWREIVESAGCGLLVNPLKLNEIVDAVVYLLENPEEAEQMGKNGRQAVLEKYSWGVEEKKLLEFYKKVLQMALK